MFYCYTFARTQLAQTHVDLPFLQRSAYMQATKSLFMHYLVTQTLPFLSLSLHVTSRIHYNVQLAGRIM